VKLLVVKKKLLTRGKDEVFSAIDTPEYLVLEFHDPVVCRSSTAGGNLPPSSENHQTYLARPPERLAATACRGRQTWRREYTAFLLG
jgi:hypothetical protein